MTTDASLDDALDVPFTFSKRSHPLPCDSRPVWRMHVLVLLLSQCREARAGFEQLHVLDWSVRTPENREAFLQFLQGKRSPNQIIVRYDPGLNRAVRFAFAEGLVVHHEGQGDGDNADESRANGYRVILADKGYKLVQSIKETTDCFLVEKAFLTAIGGKVTQKQVKSLFTWR